MMAFAESIVKQTIQRVILFSDSLNIFSLPIHSFSFHLHDKNKKRDQAGIKNRVTVDRWW